MENKNIEKRILEMCNNGTHSAKIEDIISALGFTKLELWQVLKESEFRWRIAENINKKKLLVIIN